MTADHVNLQLLVIEDRVEDFDYLEQQLKRQDIAADCVRVETGHELEAALRNRAWDAVLTDYNVPGMRFQDTVQILRAHEPDLPVLLVSGYMGEDQAAELLKAGITDFVLKYRPARLGAAIRRAVADAQEKRARRHAQSALAQSEERLRLALEGAELGTLSYEPAAQMFHLDARAQAQFGLDEHATRASLRERIHADDLARLDAALAAALRPDSDGRYQLEYRVRTADGSWRWLWASGRVELHADGSLRESAPRLAVVQDITARKQAEAALKASEERLQQALVGVQAANDRLEKEVAKRTAELRQQANYLQASLDNMPFRAWLKDTRGRYLLANRAHAEAFGATPGQMIGKTDFEIGPADSARERTARDAEVVRSRTPATWEVRHADSRLTGWFETYKAPVFDVDGEVLGTIGYARDITERKAADDAREQALTAARQLAALRSEFVANMSHEIRTPLNAVLGLAQVGMRENSGRKAHDTFAHILESGQMLLGIVNDILDFSKIEAGKLELEHLAYDPREALDRAVAMNAAAAYAKGLELRLEEAPDLPTSCQGDMLRVEQVLVNLLSNAIKFTERGWVRLGAARERDELVFVVEDSGIGMATDQAERLFQPFEQADGSTTRRYGGTGLGLAIARRLVDVMRGRIAVTTEPGAGSRFEVRLPLERPGPPLSLAGSRFVLVGLPLHEARAAERALEAVGASARAVTAAASAAERADLIVYNGATIDAAAQRALEQDVARGRRVALVRTPGESDIPLGAASFPVPILERPLRVRRLLEACRGALHMPAEVPRAARLAGVRILAAEDNAVNRLVLQETLLAEQAQLTIVDDGRALVDRVERDGPQAYDVVLTDIQMPRMDGYEAARRVRELAPQLPVIGITARALPEERQRCLAAGMVEHIAKPIDVDRLVAIILRFRTPPTPEEAPATAERAQVQTRPPSIDWQGLRAQFPSKPEFVASLLAMTEATYAETPQALRAAATRGALDEIAFIGHGLRSVAATIVAPALGEIARLAEEAARNRESGATALAETLAGHLEELLAEIAERRALCTPSAT